MNNRSSSYGGAETCSVSRQLSPSSSGRKNRVRSIASREYGALASYSAQANSVARRQDLRVTCIDNEAFVN